MDRVRMAVICAGLIVCALSAAGQNGAGAAASDHTSPSYDMKAQALLDLGAVQEKFVKLAHVIPPDKLTWRPSPDSRSFAELFLHVAGERYGILALMGGVATPSGFDAKKFEHSTTDEGQIVTALNNSWEFAQKTIKEMSNADFAKLLPKLGPEANAGDVVYILVADAHEHLGQAIAYGRENGIVPPWTAEAQKNGQGMNAKQK